MAVRKDEARQDETARPEVASAPVPVEERDRAVMEQPVHNSLPTPEPQTVDVHVTGEQPAGLFAGDAPFEAPKGVERVIRDERETDVAETKVEFNDEEATDPAIQRLNAIAGRQLTIVRGDGKTRSHGFQTLINVDSGEQVRFYPGALIEDGRWINVNYLPEAFLKSLR